MVKEEFHESICVVADEETREKDSWSNLPALLVWMIKDRLDYPNNLRFAAVCKSWLHASLNYQSAVDAPPWLMIERYHFRSKREFISTLTGERYTIDLPDFCDSFTLFSSKSWLFQVFICYTKTRMDDEFDSPFFLLNPFTKAKIKLPYMAERGYGAFDVVNGNPHCVVLACTSLVLSDSSSGYSTCIKLAITHPGENTWATHTYQCWDLVDFHLIERVFVTGKLVYCVICLHNGGSRVFIFDLANFEWTDLARKADNQQNPRRFNLQLMGRSKGKLLHVYWPQNGGGDSTDTSLVCNRLNDSSNYTEWEPLDHKELENTCWFLSEHGLDYRFSFVLKEEGIDKIYNSCKNLEAEDGGVNFRFRDDSNLRGLLLLDLIWSSYGTTVCWVDMG